MAFNACHKDTPDDPIPDPYDVVPSSIDGNLYRFGVNTNPYEYFYVYETPVPDGYQPFYISAYLRHGARGNVGVNYTPVIEAFTNAHEAGVLSTEGERAYQMILTISGMDNGTDGNLTQRGAREHRQIANRMYNKYRSVFWGGNRKIRAVSSTYQRCQESMAAFNEELESLDAQLDITSLSGSEYMVYMTSSAPQSVKTRVLDIYRVYDSIHQFDTMYFASHLFSDVTAGREAIGMSIKKLLSGTMSFAAICGAFDLDKTLINLFNVEDLKHCTRNLSQYIYLCQCNSIEFGDLCMASTRVAALIEDIIKKADTVISSGEYNADLRFGHDSHLMTFCAKIGVEGVGERLATEEAVNWLGWLYTPFSANFYMVFYKNNSGNVLVKCFINERETTLLGLPGGPYYDWETLKEYLISICSEPVSKGGMSSDYNMDYDIIIPQK